VVVQDQEARSVDDVQRHARRSRGDHRALRLRQRGGAAIIGIVAGILVVESVFFFDKIRIDDAVGAISVHGVNGAWGCLSIGLFADGTYGDGWNGVAGTVTGLFYGGGMSQFWAELIGVTTCFVTLSVLSLIVYYIAEKTGGQPRLGRGRNRRPRCARNGRARLRRHGHGQAIRNSDDRWRAMDGLRRRARLWA
jgi:hypothetical protein